MAVTLVAYRGRNDDGNESTATWRRAQNVPWIQTKDVNLRVRFLHQKTDAGALNNLDIQLQYSHNGGAFTAVTATSNVVRSSASANLADAANLTQQLTGGTGTFQGATGFDEVNGICGGSSMDIAGSGNFETEFCVQVRSADVANGDTIVLRTINSDTGSAWDVYDVTATLYVVYQPLAVADTVPVLDSYSTYIPRRTVSLSERAEVADSSENTVTVFVPPVVYVTGGRSGRFAFPLFDHLPQEDRILERAGQGQTYTVEPSDSVAVSDVATKLLRKSTDDSATISDAIRQTVAKLISDSVLVTDIVQALASKGVTLADSIAISESVVKRVSKGIPEPVIFSESIAQIISKRIADAATISDSVIVQQIGTQRISPSDTVDITETVRKVLVKRITDSFLLSESGTVNIDKPVIEEDFDLSETLSNVAARTATDTVLVTDSVDTQVTEAQEPVAAVYGSRARRFAINFFSDDLFVEGSFAVVESRSATDSVAAADVVVKTVTKAVPDTAGVTDEATTQVSRAPAEVHGSRARRFTFNFFEDESFVEQADSAQLHSRTPTDEQVAVDSVSKSIRKTVSDTLVSLDTASKSLAKSLPDSVVASDGASKSLGKTLPDNCVVSDAPTKQIAKTIPDTVFISEDLRKVIRKVVGESLLVSDTAQPTVEGAGTIYTRELSDSALISDATWKALFKRLPDSSSADDSCARTLSKIAAENQAVSDQFISKLNRNVAAGDSIAIVEALAKSLSKRLTEDQSAADAIAKILFKRFAESFLVTDESAPSVIRNQIQLSLLENFGVSDVYAKKILKTIGDLASNDETLSQRLAKSIADNQSVSDAASLSRLLRLLVGDSQYPITDQATTAHIRAVILLALAESQAASDRIAKSVFKSIADNHDAVDLFSKNLKTIFGELQTISDERSFSLAKRVTDYSDISDDKSFALLKSFADSTNLTDLFRLALAKTVSDSASINETTRKSISKFLVETEDISDSASIRHIAPFVFLAINENQALADEFSKNLLAIITDSQLVSELLLPRVVAFQPEFIGATHESNRDLARRLVATKSFITRSEDNKSPTRRVTGTKGSRT